MFFFDQSNQFQKIMKRGRNTQNSFQDKKRKTNNDISPKEKIEILSSNPRSDIVDFNTLISEFASHKHFDMALLTFEALNKKKLKPTIFTYSSLMNACVRCGEIEKAKEYHELMISEGIQPNEITYTTLIKGYLKN
jgi:pentatricopeptide repeat protein